MLNENFAYKGLMDAFERISQIPRPSFHEEKIADYIVNFAAERGLEWHRDSFNNVFVKLPATKGNEEKSAVLLQGHTDMVCEKNAGVEHDFFSDPLKLYERDGWIRAEGTTLGADNGVAVATMLYILDGAQGNIPEHPAIECLFTASEEVGLDGAKGFDYSLVSATRMINMDSADESQIIAGCAGGLRSTMRYAPVYESASGTALRLTLNGLAGGHSGEDINRGRANANKLMGRILLSASKKVDIRIASINGGSKDNAIPREAEAVVITDNAELLKKEISRLESEITLELSAEDSAFAISVCECECANMMSREASEKVVFLLASVPNGVFEMNHGIEGLVEFSRNLGVVKTNDDGNMEFTFSSRSAKDSQIDASAEQLDSYANILGMSIEHYNRYPGWVYAQKSEIRDAYADAYKALYGKEPEIMAIHAGLECGIIKEKLPEMDMISCGPIVLDLHSPDEAMNKASFERFFTVIKNVLVSL